MAAYNIPVSNLLALGEPHMNWDGHDYRKLGITAAHIPELIRMMTDMDLNPADSGAREVWAPTHAWRALAQLQAAEAVDPFLEFLARLNGENEDDWIRDEASQFFSDIGPETLPRLVRFLGDRSQGADPRWAVADALCVLARVHPQTRTDVIGALTTVLGEHATNPPELNANIIACLVELEATESAPVIEAAYGAGHVDNFEIGQLDEILEELGLCESTACEDEDDRAAPASMAGCSQGFFPPKSPGGRKDRAKSTSRRKIAKASKKRNRKNRR